MIKYPAHNCLACKKIQILESTFEIFSTFYVLSTSVQKALQSEMIYFFFYIATFEHSINCGMTAKFEFLKARF
jgi:hypothetical protein